MTAVAVAVVTAGLLWLFLAWSGEPTAPVRIDAVKTAFGVGAGAGGVFALWLATRRQRTLELQLAETTRVAGVTERDLEERRVTELYTKAVEQLGNDKAPVRLGGLYALERLGQDNPKQRQTIVNVLCAYLRMPFDGPKAGLKGTADLDPPDYDEAELLVRLAAQELLKTHLTHDEPGFWPGMAIDLQRATLVDFRLSGCTLAAADFSRARFVGAVHIRGTTFTRRVGFFGAEFTSAVNFDRSVFEEGAFFTWARFGASARFTRVRSGGRFELTRARFEGEADFEGGEHQDVDLTDARFPPGE
ncbi:pentapeptide repeat-containing protein [Amycolatopsis sp. FBCC-B4732]|uniref:pentapeptide repeat-containing protein n=1 Tax=Amycolatopsis sp. FBCC-B4732 TaxID=3079339 RepID=UPI001FF67EAA|nr:pentapeptide repeat-containing protein [Amycolatopsis sp. FBCC-B4732]UOX86420.1 pentapeptide repeat-containing protein [Amycolatopsis sp. FBCC-B4732]